MQPQTPAWSPAGYFPLFVLTFCLCLMSAWAAKADDQLDKRIIVDALINGHKAKLAFDTSADYSILFVQSAEKFGVKVRKDIATNNPDAGFPGQIFMSTSEPFWLELGKTSDTASFRILDTAIPMEVDGVLSWNDLKFNSFQIDAVGRKLIFYDNLPEEAKQWPHWKLVGKSWKDLGSRWLGFQISTNSKQHRAIYLDTGSDDGVSLNPNRLETWKSAHPDAPRSISAGYFPGAKDGLVIREEYWASNLKLTSELSLTNVPLKLCLPSEFSMESFEASLGLFAIAQLDVIVNGRDKMIYIRPAAGGGKTNHYSYNRIGAVFAPEDLAGGNLIAHVIKDSPAFAAGVRDGDSLIKIGDLDATKWKTDPRVLPLSRFWNQPAGTKIEIQCQRGKETPNFSITLKEIFTLDTASPNGPKKMESDRTAEAK